MLYKVEDGSPHCLECGDEIPYGRTDRKFCSDRCRHRHHNRESRAWRRRYARVIGILEQNHVILSRLLKMGVQTISKPDLAHMGYRFDFITSCQKVGHRTECRCFDIRYDDAETKIFHIAYERLPWDGEDG